MADKATGLPEWGNIPENDGEGQGHAPHPGGDGGWQAAGQESGPDGSSVQGVQPHNQPGDGNPQHHRHPGSEPVRLAP